MPNDFTTFISKQDISLTEFNWHLLQLTKSSKRRYNLLSFHICC